MGQANLDRLIEQARLIEMTSGDRREQTISFAYGNAVLDGCKVTREIVKEAYDELVRQGRIKP